MRSIPRPARSRGHSNAKPIVRAAIAGIAGIASVLAVAGCTATPAEEDVDRTLTVGTLGLGANWNPLTGGLILTSGMQGAVFDSLLDWDVATDSYSPNLATEIEFSDDRTTIDIQLRDDVDFVDGEHLTAEGVKTYLEALLASEYALNGSVAPYEPVFEVTDEYSLRISTSKPAYLGDFGRALFYFIPIISPGAIDDPERAEAEPLGSGAYIIEEFDGSTELTLVRNPDHWNPDAFAYDKVVLKVLADETARLNALKSGQVDLAPISISQGTEAEASGLVLTSVAAGYDSLIIQNPAESPLPALRDVRVRQALMYAFDRESILDALYSGYGVASSQMFPEGSPFHVEGGDDRYGYDPDLARELLAEAGYPDGFDVTIPISGATAGIEPIVQQALADIGVRVTFENVADWFAAGLSGQYPLTIWQGATVYRNNLRYLTEDFPGIGRWIIPTPEVEELIATVKGADADAAAEAAAELGEFLLEEAWVIPIAHPATLWASVPEVDLTKLPPGLEPDLRDVVPAE